MLIISPHVFDSKALNLLMDLHCNHVQKYWGKNVVAHYYSNCSIHTAVMQLFSSLNKKHTIVFWMKTL